MKKLFLLAIIALSLLASPVYSNETYQDWIWLNGSWVWVGTGDPEDPPPPIRR